MKNQKTFLFAPGSVSLGTTLSNVGHEFVTGSYRNDCWLRGTSEFYVWQYTLAGCGFVKMSDGAIRSDKGKAILVKIPSSATYFHPAGVEPWEFIYVTVAGEEACRICAHLVETYGNVLMLPDSSACVKQAWRIFEEGTKERITSQYAASEAAYAFLMALLGDMDGAGQSLVARRLLDKITAWVALHIEENINCERLARKFGYSKRHFSRIFSVATGTTPQQFICETRMRMAAMLLQGEGATVKEIAGKVGFTDVSYFCKLFRKYHGISPKRYRNGLKV